MKPAPAESRSVVTPCGTLQYTFQRKRVKNLNARIRKDGSVAVSAPMRTPLSAVEQFLCSRAAFIFAAKEKYAAQASKRTVFRCQDGDCFPMLGGMMHLRVIEDTAESAQQCGDTLTLYVRDTDDLPRRQKLFDAWIDAQCRTVFTAVMQETAALFSDLPAPTASLRIRTMVSRWGTCHTQKHIITMNRRLIEAPRCCIRYVLIHELTHFFHADHSRAFYALMEQKCPDWRACKELLEQSVIL